MTECEPISQPAFASSRSSSQPSIPGAPTVPAGTKTVPGKPSSDMTGNACSSTLPSPSSNVTASRCSQVGSSTARLNVIPT